MRFDRIRDGVDELEENHGWANEMALAKTSIFHFATSEMNELNTHIHTTHIHAAAIRIQFNGSSVYTIQFDDLGIASATMLC